ncbi:MAG: hypothetical protein ACOYN5_05600 [Bacteroidales bacterium]
MKNHVSKIMLICLFLLFVCSTTQAQEQLIYHEIQTDVNGKILPWSDPDPSIAFDQIIQLIWDFWQNMRMDPNGLPYYMNHQVWEEFYNDRRGIGGDQIQMALSAWRLLYAYSGDERIKANMRFMADYYLSHSLSSPDADWPSIPYPYNTLIYSGFYDGDMVIGKGFTQPDKAGSFGFELVNLYKMTGQRNYLEAAIQIANTLAKHTMKGDSIHSPIPFKVNAETGETGTFTASLEDQTVTGISCYTTNWAPTMSLFLSLQEMKTGQTNDYQTAFQLLHDWTKAYPLRNNRWGPFFEDVSGWSDTQINAMTMARFIMEHQAYFPDWQKDVQNIVDWVYSTLGNKQWEKYGVIAINEQTSFPVPGNSHTARQGTDELLFARLTGNMTNYDRALRQLIWACYMVDTDGKNRFPTIEIWLTDGYGDYIRHYLRAMAAFPEIAPANTDHILSSTSVIQQADYHGRHHKELKDESGKLQSGISYETFDNHGTEQIRMIKRPTKILLNGNPLSETGSGEGYIWKALQAGGILTINRLQGKQIDIHN